MGRAPKNYERDGMIFTIQDVCTRTGLHPDTVGERLRLWVQRKIDTEDLFAPRCVKPGPKSNIYAVGNRSYTAMEISRKTGVSLGHAHKRLRLWVRGKLTHENLLKPSQKLRLGTDNHCTKKPKKEPKWMQEAIKKVPGPTPYEKKLEKMGIL